MAIIAGSHYPNWNVYRYYPSNGEILKPACLTATSGYLLDCRRLNQIGYPQAARCLDLPMPSVRQGSLRHLKRRRRAATQTKCSRLDRLWRWDQRPDRRRAW
jgi:hypothetical protein